MLHWQTSHITITILILPEYSNDFSQKNINTITLQSDITIHKLQFVHNLPSCNEKKSLGTYIICSIQIAIYSLVQNWFQPCIFCVCISYHYFFCYNMISFIILLSKTMKEKTKYEHNISWIYVLSNNVLTIFGLYGGWTSRSSILSHCILLKNAWSFISLSPFDPQPNRLLGVFVSNCGQKLQTCNSEMSQTIQFLMRNIYAFCNVCLTLL